MTNTIPPCDCGGRLALFDVLPGWPDLFVCFTCALIHAHAEPHCYRCAVLSDRPAGYVPAPPAALGIGATVTPLGMSIDQLGALAAFERAASEMIDVHAWQLRSTVRGERFTITRETDGRSVRRDE